MKSHVSMLVCPWCGESTAILLDRRLKDSLERTTQDNKPCDSCLKDSIILIEKSSKQVVGYAKKERHLNPKAIEKFKGQPVKCLVEAVDGGFQLVGKDIE